MIDDNVLTLPLARLKAPDDLTPTQMQVWRDVIAAKPADWFDGGNIHLLKTYCKVAVECTRIAKLIDANANLETTEGLRRYAALTRIKTAQTSTLIALSRQLRLGQQQTIRAAKANVVRTAQRPWEQK